MEQALTPGPGQNRLLQLLSASDAERLRPHLERAVLRKGEPCIQEGRPIDHVYFLESGLGSSIFPDEGRGTLEIGRQGYEGLIGAPALLGADASPHRVFMQVGGVAQRIPVRVLAEAMDASPGLRLLLLRYAQVFLVQTAQTVYTRATSL